MRGPVTRILRKHGCGVVLTEMGDEVFFGSYALDGIGIDELEEGQWVEFELYELEMGRATITRLRSVMQPSQEKTSAAVRSFVIWGEELSRKGRYAAAEKLYLHALALVERTLGTSHPIAAEVLDCYADLLAKMNRNDEGVTMKSRSEAIWNACVPSFSIAYKDLCTLHPCSVEQEGSD